MEPSLLAERATSNLQSGPLQIRTIFMTVRTRFAPSPTGMLHIGGARTALFNFLFARHYGGTYLLRIEDTDKARSTKEAIDAIMDSLTWLGLSPDEPPVFQSAREERHAAVARELVQRGRAYHCYCTAEELNTMREQARAEGRPPRYDSRWRDRDPSEAPAGAPYTIRLKAPQTGETVLEDLVQGKVTVANAELDDMIILRSDGITPTYLHAVVVDDFDMDITHVIRGDDHLTNTFRQIQIYEAMGWKLPRFAHLPMIHGPDGAKLSKRHGASSVMEFSDQGFLPDALCNYLLRLGWGHGDTEILSRYEAIKLFDLDGVGRAPGRMDYAKLNHTNGVYLRQADNAQLADAVLKRLASRPDVVIDETVKQRLEILMPALKERAKTLVDLSDSAAFLARRLPLQLEPKAATALTDDARSLLRGVRPELDGTDFTPEALHGALQHFAGKIEIKLGQIAQPLRAALTGSLQSPPIDQTLAALGRDEALARIDAVLIDAVL
jgi:glutamyl-tRNA synthetase